VLRPDTFLHRKAYLRLLSISPRFAKKNLSQRTEALEIAIYAD
jgi:hypothetical protein